MKRSSTIAITVLVFAGVVFFFNGEFAKAATFDRNIRQHRFEQALRARVAGLKPYELQHTLDSAEHAQRPNTYLITLLSNRIKEVKAEEGKEEQPYPAHDLYKVWNTQKTHPYPESLCKDDSCLTLCLVDREMECGYEQPHKGVVTSGFGWRHGRMHNGVDIDLWTGDTVRAAFRGVVRIARWQGGYGRVVVIRHHNGLETIYGHLSRFLVKAGDKVDPGQAIGKGGNSGNSRGSHLHLETRFKGKAINPQSIIDFKTGALKHDSIIVKKTKSGFIAYQPGGAFHKIRRGDYLWKIAQEYSTTVRKICQLNGIRRSHFLVVGEELKVSQ